jgi:predicted DNA binding protein
MTQARLSIALPDGVWITEVSTAHPEASFRVLAAMPGAGEDAGFGVVRITAPDVDPILAGMRAAEDLTSLSVVQRTEGQVLVQFETTEPLILLSARESRMPIELPVDIREGVATVEVTGSREHLSELGEQLRAFGLRFEVEYVHERVDTEGLLSERQREVLLAAVECGYYDTPRECSLTELAEELGVAKSTCSETLHRVEEVVVKRFVRELPEASEGMEPPIPTERS